ncbi:2-amino-4-hydroxy-6-hydroxymethyldihydropteridine diphosphokinase [Rhodoligotrophos appendicifer]|uniref:2-amino-4-hydroxy-6- hydroxymethyldihydropteridine diphosphokinase n=1 Tax=Rhodoligotrophos appendicifer TaxID=987056 RepID=UPI0011846FDB|nr:2-amino-4-hydroxy-6-hydroxymethyldihydropteridine diphosphokinase [Rhodoligotrophos appendicifer]
MFPVCSSQILIGLGSNLSGPWGTPAETVERAIGSFSDSEIFVLRASTILRTSPYGKLHQPSFANAVIAVTTHLPPHALLKRLHTIEHRAGRKRGERWGPRVLDLDLLAYGDLVTRRPTHQEWKAGRRHPLVLPHPELPLRPFVLRPIQEIAPFWHHPISGLTAAQMGNRLMPARGGRILGRA